MADKLKLDSAGVLEVLKSGPVRAQIHDLATKVASAVGAQIDPEAEVVVDDYTTDRAASSVTIRDNRGRVWEVRDGVLTKAAAGAGLEVRT